MTTMREEITTERQVTDTPGQRQRVEITNPIYLNPSMTGVLTSYSKDRVSSTMKTTNVNDILEGWKLLTRNAITKGRSQWDEIWYYKNSLSELKRNMSNFLMNEGAYELHQSYRWHLTFKITMYSSFQHQGAMVVVVAPFVLNAAKTEVYCLENFDQPRYFNGTLDRDVGPWVSQLPHKIISFGQNSEIIVDLPFISHYDSIPAELDTHVLNYVGVFIWDPLTTVEGVADGIQLQIDYKLQVETIGANFDADVAGLGQLVA